MSRRASAGGGQRASTGMTLVELLITLSLIALVAGTITATFSGGIGVWERIQQHGRRDQWADVALDEIRRDLQNARRFSPIKFAGEYDEVSFASVVPWARRGEVVHDEPGRLAYYFDSMRHRLCRSETAYRLLRRARVRDSCHSVLEPVDRARFSYYRADPDGQAEGTWADSWDEDQPPLAVKVELSYDDPATHRPLAYTCIVHVPVASPR